MVNWCNFRNQHTGKLGFKRKYFRHFVSVNVVMSRLKITTISLLIFLLCNFPTSIFYPLGDDFVRLGRTKHDRNNKVVHGSATVWSKRQVDLPSAIIHVVYPKNNLIFVKASFSFNSAGINIFMRILVIFVFANILTGSLFIWLIKLLSKHTCKIRYNINKGNHHQPC